MKDIGTDLHAMVLPDGYTNQYSSEQAMSRRLEELLVRYLNAIGRWDQEPGSCTSMDTYARLHIPAPLVEMLRIERKRPNNTLFYQGYQVEAEYVMPQNKIHDQVRFSCNRATGYGYVAPSEVPGSAVEIYVTLRKDGMGAEQALQTALLL